MIIKYELSILVWGGLPPHRNKENGLKNSYIYGWWIADWTYMLTTYAWHVEYPLSIRVSSSYQITYATSISLEKVSNR